VIRAGVYARISSDREGDNLAISRQLADCEQLAERNGWQVVERYVDSDISAYSGKPRPEYARMLEEIEAGVVEAVLVYHADRLHRHPRELEDFIDLCQRQRIKLAIQMGEKGDTHVLDEPTTGLHLADVQNILGLLDRLVESGKTVIVIEHHQAVMARADWIIDIGPGAGHDGGRVVFEGSPADLVAAKSTLTGEHLAAYVGA